MTSPTVAAVSSRGFWDGLVERYSARFAARPSKVNAYRELVSSGAMDKAAAAYAAGLMVLTPPRRFLLNRSGGRRKTVYMFPPHDDLFLKGLNHALQPLSDLHSPLCHSFQRGRGVRTAYAALRQAGDLVGLSCLHVDIRDYFASIPVERLLESLPPPIADDAPLMTLLSDMLGVEGGGVLAGTPLAPLLSNLYLRSLDDAFESSGLPYLRYADDLILFDKPESIIVHQQAIAIRLAELGLEINPRKLRLSPPGEAWEFLGLRNDNRRVNLASTTVSKMHHRVRRLSRRARGRRDPARYLIRRLNRKLFGFGADVSAFTWATWFFPLISSDASLRRLDRVIQDQIRFAVTGRHERRNLGVVPYAHLAARGYLPLVTAFRAYRQGPAAYESLLDRRLRRCAAEPRFAARLCLRDAAAGQTGTLKGALETEEIVRSFYNALGQKDDGWHDRLADDVMFSDASGRLQARGREAFIQSFTTFLRAVEKLELKQLIVDGSQAAAVVSYDYVNPHGDRLHQDDAEVWQVEDGRIVSLTIYFDITEFRAFMAS